MKWYILIISCFKHVFFVQRIYFCVVQLLQLQPDSISITAVLVEYETLTKRQMHGVATGWLRYKRPTDSEKPTVPIFVRKSQFRLPYKPSVPVILVGPGTGLAPMRAFIQDRYAIHRDGKPDLSSLCLCVFVIVPSLLWLCWLSSATLIPASLLLGQSDLD